MLFQSELAHAETLAGTAHVIDGDTLEIGNRVIRLYGIDAAEAGQRCAAAKGQIVRPGEWAADRVSSLVSSGVSCIGSQSDEYGRLIAVCTSPDGIQLNSILVGEGLAWAFTKFSSDYVHDELGARKARLGIWSIRCQEPWKFRQQRWNAVVQKSPSGCPIKGNISERGKIYHTPWSRHYTVTRVDLSKGERWFCNEGEALKAGWRPPVR